MFTTDIIIRVGFAAGVTSLLLSIYLLLQCRQQKRHMKQLMQQLKIQAEESKALLDQVRSTVLPHFEPAGISLNESINRIDIKVQNLGAAAIIEKVVTSTPDIEFLDDRFFPLRIESNEQFIITGLSKGLPLDHCRYVVQLHYSDIHGNRFLTAIRGEGADCRLTTSSKT